MSEPQSDDPIVAALLRERAGLVQRGLEPRIVQVDEQLAARGYATADGERGVEPGQEAANKPSAPKGRQTRPGAKAAG